MSVMYVFMCVYVCHVVRVPEPLCRDRDHGGEGRRAAAAKHVIFQAGEDRYVIVLSFEELCVYCNFTPTPRH